MFHSTFPQVLAGSIIGQVESQECIITLSQFFAQLDEKLLAFEGNFDNFGPAEGVHFYGILKDDKTDTSHSKLNGTTLRIFAGMQRNAIHFQPFGVFQKIHFGFAWTLTFV